MEVTLGNPGCCDVCQLWLQTSNALPSEEAALHPALYTLTALCRMHWLWPPLETPRITQSEVESTLGHELVQLLH